MLYGTPTPTAHRATPEALLVRGGTVGAHRHSSVVTRPRPQRRIPYEPVRAANWLFRGLAAVIVLGVAVMIGFLALADRRTGAPTAAPGQSPADPLATRAGDPRPLTLQEVFPGSDTVLTPGSTYRIGLTHLDTECRTATLGALGPLLAEHGCSQVVRAELATPRGDYEVTAGVFNLADAAGATAVDGQLRSLVETGDGGFASFGGGTSGPTGQVGWRTRGHYLVYCVITRPGGEVVTAGDPTTARITTDLVDSYLGDRVLGDRDSRA